MKSAYLIYTKYYDFENARLTIGGVQTYIEGLCDVLVEEGYTCKIYQTGDKNNTIELSNKVSVCQVDTSKYKTRSKKIQSVYDSIERIYNDDNDLLIFLANEIICDNNASKSIAIQHGISWDYLYDKKLSKIRNIAHYFIKAKNSFKIIKRLNGVKTLVCVDHNFPNWLRSTAIKCDTSCMVIPNFTKIAPRCEKPSETINIIFARRFFSYRGTRIFGPAILNVLQKYSNVEVTIAGDGPDEEYLREILKGYENRVKFVRYKTNESLSVHKDMHIALVPTIGSEGTSLSLLEAMSARCAVICTDAGGLSNIVLDGFNGLFTERNSEELEEKISYLIENENVRKTIADNAYETVKQGFSYESWKNRWKKVIQKVNGKK